MLVVVEVEFGEEDVGLAMIECLVLREVGVILI
jgi:hypothetical protein